MYVRKVLNSWRTCYTKWSFLLDSWIVCNSQSRQLFLDVWSLRYQYWHASIILFPLSHEDDLSGCPDPSAEEEKKKKKKKKNETSTVETSDKYIYIFFLFAGFFPPLEAPSHNLYTHTQSLHYWHPHSKRDTCSCLLLVRGTQISQSLTVCWQCWVLAIPVRSKFSNPLTQKEM